MHSNNFGHNAPGPFRHVLRQLVVVYLLCMYIVYIPLVPAMMPPPHMWLHSTHKMLSIIYASQQYIIQSWFSLIQHLFLNILTMYVHCIHPSGSCHNAPPCRRPFSSQDAFNYICFTIHNSKLIFPNTTLISQHTYCTCALYTSLWFLPWCPLLTCDSIQLTRCFQ